MIVKIRVDRACWDINISFNRGHQLFDRREDISWYTHNQGITISMINNF